MYDVTLLLIVAALVFVFVAICLRSVGLWKARMVEYLREEIERLEGVARSHAEQVLQANLRDLFHETDSFDAELAEAALDLICHASVLRQERELTYAIPRLFGSRRAVLRAYARHIMDMEVLRQKLKRKGLEHRSIERLAQTM